MITPGDKGRDVHEHSCGNFLIKELSTLQRRAPPFGSGATFTETGAHRFGSSAAERGENNGS